MTSSNAAPFIAARDFLLRHREDYASAYRDFRWPKLDRFNWALDYFDVMARGNADPALWLVDEDAGETKLSFAALSERSNQVANALRALGVRRGDRILVMLGNVVPLWECMLAAMKLGAVIVPATTLLTRNDLADRFARGRVRHVIAGAEACAKFADLPGDYTRIAVGNAVPGWIAFENAYRASAEFTPDGETRPDDPVLLYFTSGTTATPKLVLHSHQSYPVGHLSTMYWLGLRPGDVHLNISSPGWAKHAWSCFFSPWNAQAAVFIVNQRRFNARGLLDTIARCGVTTFCAPPTVWRMLIQEDLSAWRVAHQGTDQRRRAAQSRSHRAGQGGLGHHHPRRLRPDRDDGAGRQYAGAESEARLDGPAAAGLSRRAARCRRRGGARRRDLPRARAAADRADARLSGRRRRRARAPRRGLSHRRRRGSRRRRLSDLCRPRRRRVQILRLPHQPVRAGERADRASGGRRGRRRAVARSAAACGAEGFFGAGARPPAGPRYRAVDLPPLPDRAGAVQAGAAARIRRSAEDDFRQNPARRAAPRRGGKRRRRQTRCPRILGR